MGQDLHTDPKFPHSRISQLRTLVLNLWDRQPDVPVDLTITSLTDAHQTIAACEAAPADFPQARRLLEAQLDQAKAKLAQFQRK